MAAFLYKVIDTEGVAQFGEIDALNRDMAVDRLSVGGAAPVWLNPKKEGLWARINEPVELRRHVGMAGLTELTRSWARLLVAGVSIERSLTIMIECQKPGAGKALLERILAAVKGGDSLAAALAQEDKVFPLYYINMVRAGEMSGSLEATFQRLARLLVRSLKFRQEVRSALIYPAILMVMIALTLILVVTVVLPEFETIFAGAGAELPGPTKLVMAVGDLITGWWWLALLLIAGGTLGIIEALKRPAVRLRADRKLLRLKLVGGMTVRADLVRFLRTLGTMLDQGVALDEGWAIAAHIPKNTAIHSDLAGAIAPLKEGSRVSIVLSSLGYVPSLALQLVRVGEETGSFGSTMIEAADILEDEQELHIKRFLTVFTPVITLLLGGIVAAFVGSVLLGILSINDLAI